MKALITEIRDNPLVFAIPTPMFIFVVALVLANFVPALSTAMMVLMCACWVTLVLMIAGTVVYVAISDAYAKARRVYQRNHRIGFRNPYMGFRHH